MNPFSQPADESERVRVLHALRILDTPAEAGFDAIARLAGARTGCPIGALSLVDSTRQWFKAVVGLGLAETPRADSFCNHTILSTDVLVVPDATQDPRFAASPLVTGSPHRAARFAASSLLLRWQPIAARRACPLAR